MRSFIYLLPVLLFAGVVATFAVGLDRDPAKLPSTLIDKPLPPFDLPALRDGEAGLKSSDIRGQPRLLNVFASWCVTCRLEHPVLLALKARGVPIDGLDWKDQAAAGASYLIENGDPYARVGNDQLGRAGIDLGVAAVPETFVVDARGRVRYKQVGPITPDDWTHTIAPLMDRLKAGGMTRLAAMVCALAFAAGHAAAVLPDEQLKDPKLESRARAIGSQLRCVVCQTQTIDDSDADLARDLRILIRQRLVAGDSDRQAIEFVVRRYGKFVLMKPPMDGETWLLWLGPAMLLGAGGAAVAVYWRGRAASMPPLGDAERAALDEVGRGDAA